MTDALIQKSLIPWLKQHLPARFAVIRGSMVLAAVGFALWAFDTLLCSNLVPARLFVASLGLLSAACVYQYFLSKRVENFTQELEARVMARTAELALANSSLEKEVYQKGVIESSLRNSEERYYCLSEATTEGIIIHKKGVMIDGNHVMGDMLGSSLEKIVGKHVSKMFDNNLVEKESIKLGPGCQSVIEGELKREDGSTMPVEITCRAFPFFGQRVHVAAVRDISQRKAWELEVEKSRDAALESARFKSRFLANMSHEIRTPMNAMIGLNDLLADTNLDPVQLDFVETARQSAQSLLSLINNILDISKIEAGQVKLKKEPFNPRDVLERAVGMFRARAQAKGIQLNLFAASNLPARLAGDPLRLGQVLVNLVGNAVKFTDHGEVTVSAGFSAGGNGSLQIGVEDTGPGIDPSQVSRLFQPFVQLDNSTARHFEGTGLGLAITHEIVDLMGGQILVESRPVRKLGSAFIVNLPLEIIAFAEDRADLATQRFSGKKVSAKQGAGRVLVVEDNPVNQKVALHQLERLGFEADIVANGKRAVEAISRHAYDLVLMDCQMPVMDGFEATSRIRQGEVSGHKPRIPIVAMTANAMSEDSQHCLDSGMDDYIAKPVDLERLGLVLHKWVVPLVALRRSVGVGAKGDRIAAEIFKIFKAETPGRMQILATLLKAGDGEAFARNAHALQGGCAAVGAHTMAQLAKKLVQQGQAGDLAGAGDILGQVWNEYEKVLDFFKIEFKNTGA